MSFDDALKIRAGELSRDERGEVTVEADKDSDPLLNPLAPREICTLREN